jgi:hypothetical protein
MFCLLNMQIPPFQFQYVVGIAVVYEVSPTCVQAFSNCMSQTHIVGQFYQDYLRFPASHKPIMVMTNVFLETMPSRVQHEMVMHSFLLCLLIFFHLLSSYISPYNQM